MRIGSSVTDRLFCLQDFPISVHIIWNQWRANKMSDKDCERELIRCKDRGAPAALLAMEQIRKKAAVLALEDQIKYVQDELEKQQAPFRDHPTICKFVKQFDKSTYARLARRMCLVLVGDSQQGKTSKGMSLWGKARTLKLSCGPCGEGVLPSLAAFDRNLHDAILFDEARMDQVLKNRELFQGNEFLQTLGSSQCNPYAYSIWVYNVGLIVCCNEFDLTRPTVSVGDVDWITKNCHIVALGETTKWYIEGSTTVEEHERAESP